jgi:hypothetical protein
MDAAVATAGTRVAQLGLPAAAALATRAAPVLGARASDAQNLLEKLPLTKAVDKHKTLQLLLGGKSAPQTVSSAIADYVGNTDKLPSETFWSQAKKLFPGGTGAANPTTLNKIKDLTTFLGDKLMPKGEILKTVDRIGKVMANAATGFPDVHRLALVHPGNGKVQVLKGGKLSLVDPASYSDPALLAKDLADTQASVQKGAAPSNITGYRNYTDFLLRSEKTVKELQDLEQRRNQLAASGAPKSALLPLDNRLVALNAEVEAQKQVAMRFGVMPRPGSLQQQAFERANILKNIGDTQKGIVSSQRAPVRRAAGTAGLAAAVPLVANFGLESLARAYPSLGRYINRTSPAGE